MIRVGTAGWSLPKSAAEFVVADGTHLERYGGTFTCVEINSTFSKAHRASTYERWASSVPADFAFSLKLPQDITHVRRLEACDAELERFLADSAPLGDKRAVLLVQLPPSFAFADECVGAFFASLRKRYGGRVACEPRHASWFTGAVDAVLRTYEVTRVAADPAVTAEAALPGGWAGFAYYRRHGVPRIYYSRYDDADIERLAARLTAGPPDAWCIFDNSAAGAATQNALALTKALQQRPASAACV